MKRPSLIGFTVLIFLAAIPLMAQEQTASIQGSVIDASGAALPGATIEAVNTKGQRFTAQSDGSGKYRFPSIPSGTYTLKAELSGMEPAVAKDVVVTLGSTPRVDLKLRVAAVAETLTVTAEAPLVDVTSNAAATSIRSETFDKLPRGRDYSTIVTQAPSANQNAKTGGISIDGASGSENRFIMDGVDTTNPQTGVQGKTLVTNFVDEVQVKSSGYAAEFGGATGGVINVVTKTGTNDFKGAVNAYYNANTWSGESSYVASNQELTRGPFLQLKTDNTGFVQTPVADDTSSTIEPGASLGGSILRDRLWFFAAYEPWLRSTERTINNVTYEQEFERKNWIGTLSGSGGTKLLYKASFNNSGYETTNLLPTVSGRGSTNALLYAPDDKLENWTTAGYADFVATPQWFFSTRGGRFYRNYSQTGVSRDVLVSFATGPTSAVFPEIPASLIRSTGFSNIPTNTASQKDAYTRDNFNFDVSWFPQMAGAHRIKAGVQIDNLKNEVLRGQQNYLVTATWNGVCPQCTGRGRYGSAGVYVFQTTGDVESKNTGFFVQDSWTTMRDRLTLNIGVRTEQEKVPSYAAEGTPTTGKYAINFNYGDKLAPRLGFSYDIFGTGRSKAYGSYGTFYDITKMEMPRGSFGGDKWIYWGFDLDSFDWTQWDKCTNVTNNVAVKPTCPGMTLRSSVDLRHPSNSEDLPLVDPNLKPMESREFSLGFQQEITNSTAVGFRYVNKSLIRTIEDVGVHVTFPDGSEAEEFFIANPGFGVAQKILEAFGCTICPAMPKAKRDYDGYELEFTKRFTGRWALHASYLYSRLQGNYSGLANSDEVTANPGTARTSPNVNRIFDSLFMLFDRNGDEVEGPLGGDRPHQAKAQLSYSFPIGTLIGVSQFFYSGTPTTTEMRFQGAPIFPFGRNDIGRTPNITQTDFTAQHDIPFGRFNLQLGAIVLNLFDEKKATNYYPIRSTTSIVIRDLSRCPGDLSVAVCGASAVTPRIGPQTGTANNATQAAAFFGQVDWERQFQRQVALGLIPDWRYGQPNSYQDPREVRVYAKFTF